MKIEKPKPKGIRSTLIYFLGGVPNDVHNRALSLFDSLLRVCKNAHIKNRILKRRNALLEEQNSQLRQKIEILEKGGRNAKNRD